MYNPENNTIDYSITLYQTYPVSDPVILPFRGQDCLIGLKSEPFVALAKVLPSFEVDYDISKFSAKEKEVILLLFKAFLIEDFMAEVLDTSIKIKISTAKKLFFVIGIVRFFTECVLCYEDGRLLLLDKMLAAGIHPALAYYLSCFYINTYIGTVSCANQGNHTMFSQKAEGLAFAALIASPAHYSSIWKNDGYIRNGGIYFGNEGWQSAQVLDYIKWNSADTNLIFLADKSNKIGHGLSVSDFLLKAAELNSVFVSFVNNEQILPTVEMNSEVGILSPEVFKNPMPWPAIPHAPKKTI